jgi:hypothetical protein
MLKELDLAELSFYEQAQQLTDDLLKQWLVKYKFSTWTTHREKPAEERPARNR